MKPFFLLVALVPFCALAGPLVGKEPFFGKVTGVADGDTITVMRENGQLERIGLEWIDAPEMDQPFGKDSRKDLSRMIKGKNVRVEAGAPDSYGRKPGQVWLEDVNINEEQVARGNAWNDRNTSGNPNLLQLQKRAQTMKMGLWALPYPVEPSIWRSPQSQKHLMKQVNP